VRADQVVLLLRLLPLRPHCIFALPYALHRRWGVTPAVRASRATCLSSATAREGKQRMPPFQVTAGVRAT